MYVSQEDFWAYVVVEGDAELSPVASAPDDATVEELVDTTGPSPESIRTGTTTGASWCRPPPHRPAASDPGVRHARRLDPRAGRVCFGSVTSVCVGSARGADPYDRPVLADLALILLAAKLAAEACELVRVPAVVGEIVVGVLIGPSLLGWVVADSEAVMALAELGVLLLLVQVGMEMDLAELGALGRPSMLVAVVGVAVPFPWVGSSARIR